MKKVPLSLRWIYPKMDKPSWMFRFASYFVVGTVGLFSRILVLYLNKTKIHNSERLQKLMRRPEGRFPLVTVSNHYSCFDDPALWGSLALKDVCSSKRMRWSMAAHDICFTNKLFSYFFMLGKCIPVVRGNSIYQPAVDLCIQKLQRGEWVHIFPEGKVNMAKEQIRFKWGVGRILLELKETCPDAKVTVLPIFHVGMDELLPNTPPYWFHFNTKLTFNFGKPIDLNETFKQIEENKTDKTEARRLITEVIQKRLESLRAETEVLHKKS